MANLLLTLSPSPFLGYYYQFIYYYARCKSVLILHNIFIQEFVSELSLGVTVKE
jgi:hypothetical protein